MGLLSLPFIKKDSRSKITKTTFSKPLEQLTERLIHSVTPSAERGNRKSALVPAQPPPVPPPPAFHSYLPQANLPPATEAQSYLPFGSSVPNDQPNWYPAPVPQVIQDSFPIFQSTVPGRDETTRDLDTPLPTFQRTESPLPPLPFEATIRQPLPQGQSVQFSNFSRPGPEQPLLWQPLPSQPGGNLTPLQQYALLQPLNHTRQPSQPLPGPQGYHPFQANSTPFLGSEGSAGRSSVYNANHFPTFAPDSSFQTVVEENPEIPPVPPPKGSTPPQQDNFRASLEVRRQTPQPLQPQVEVLSPTPSGVVPSVSQASPALLTDMSTVGWTPMTTMDKGKGRAKDGSAGTKSRVSMPPVNGTSPASYRKPVRHSTPPTHAEFAEILKQGEGTPQARHKVLPWAQSVERVTTIDPDLAGPPKPIHNKRSDSDFNHATGTRPSSRKGFKYKDANGHELTHDEKARLHVRNGRASDASEDSEPKLPPDYRSMLVADIERAQAIENVYGPDADDGKIHTRLVEDKETLQALDSGALPASGLSEVLGRGARQPEPAADEAERRSKHGSPEIKKKKDTGKEHKASKRDKSEKSPKAERKEHAKEEKAHKSSKSPSRDKPTHKHKHISHDSWPDSFYNKGAKRDEAVREALAQLEGTGATPVEVPVLVTTIIPPTPGSVPVAPATSMKGKRLTYDSFLTDTKLSSDLSFGHLYHQDGKPVPAPLLPPGFITPTARGVPPPVPSAPQSRQVSGGPPPSFQPDLEHITEGGESRHDIRSPKVETVVDEQAEELGLSPKDAVAGDRVRAASTAPSQHASLTRENIAELAAQSVVSTDVHGRLQKFVESASIFSAPSVTSTTQLKRLVNDSGAHDETLCELLDAVRNTNNGVGEKARLALKRAAESRIKELCVLKEQVEKLKAAGSGTPPLNIKKKRDGNREKRLSSGPSLNQSERTQYSSDATAKVSTPNMTSQDAPDWGRELLERVTAIQTLLARADTEYTSLSPESSHFRPQSSPLPPHWTQQQPGQDFPGQFFFHPDYEPVAPVHYNLSPHASIHTIPTTHVESPPVDGVFSPKTKMNGSAAPSHTRQPNGTVASSDQARGSARYAIADRAFTSSPADQDGAYATQQGDENGPGGRSCGATDTDMAGINTPRAASPAGPPKITIQSATRTNSHSAPTPKAFTMHSPSGTPRESISHDVSPEGGQQEHQKNTTVAGTEPRSVTAHSSPRSRVKEKPETVVSVPRTEKEKIALLDPISPPLPSPAPWDLVAQKLHSWVMVWEEDSLQRALAAISIGQEVGELPLTVFVMKTFKRNLRYRLTNNPPMACDKMYIPPIIAETINKAVFAHKYDDAVALLKDMWTEYGFKQAPRIIITTTRHHHHNLWQANRYDLSTGRLTTYLIGHESETVKDGRPFYWWRAISKAWPEYNIPDVETLHQAVKTLPTLPQHMENNSLRAAVVSRNVLLGTRPEAEHELSKVRDYIWAEVKQLLVQKRQGTLMIK